MWPPADAAPAAVYGVVSAAAASQARSTVAQWPRQLKAAGAGTELPAAVASRATGRGPAALMVYSSAR